MSEIRARRHTDGRWAMLVKGTHWVIGNPGRSHLTGWLDPIAHENEVFGDGWSELLVAELPETDWANENVVVNGAMLFAGILVGISGQHDSVPSDGQIERAVALIMRAGRRRQEAVERLLTAAKRCVHESGA